ncbi:GNAT family N-acetyltransferase [Krasilnikovia sp. MM14-A1259]|uniref:GNAT family N-acetyltransferase n=1 Tax=Krasilnikovia sp. MM14-A1259 TaxID=3373539 RepID=UPI00382232BB
MALWRIRATVDDRPGYLSVLTASLALRSVNILAVHVHTTEAGAVDDFLVDAPDTMSESDMIAAVERGRGRDVFVARAEAQGLADQPTRALALAGRLVHDPDLLGEALVTLLDADGVRWHPEPVAGPGFDGRRMTLLDPVGGAYELLRRAPEFTPAEYARAQALVEVSAAALRQHAEHATLLLPDGSELLVRPAGPDDADGVLGLHRRASVASLQRRYLGSAPAEPRLRRLLEPAGGVTVLAVDLHTDRVVAMASLLAEGELGEVALLVEDGWQRRGVGTALLRRLLAYAERVGFAAVVAHTSADNAGMLRTLRRLGAGRTDRDGPMTSVTLPVARALRATGPAAPATRR